MNISVNGHSKVPPGFRFHPTEEELLQYYLKKKLAFEKIDLDVIREIDLNKLEPWDIPELCGIGSGPQNEWYFFSHKDMKYPKGTRTNRATAAGFWKATGRDKMIYSNNICIGMRKTLVFNKGRAPNAEKSCWIMHEYRLEDCTATYTVEQHDQTSVLRDDTRIADQEGWVICRLFWKKNYQMANDHIFFCMGKTYQDEHYHAYETSNTENPLKEHQGRLIIHDDHMINSSYNQLILNSPILSADDHQYSLPVFTSIWPPFDQHHRDDPTINLCHDNQILANAKPRFNDWITLDRFIASQLNGEDEELMMCSNSFTF